jgi:signal transduction histidine kinase
MIKIKINDIFRKYTSARLETKLGIAFFGLAVLISALVTLAAYLNFSFKAREDLRKRLRDIVSVAALQLDGDLHSTLTNPEQEGSSAYMQIKQTLQNIGHQVPDIRFIYTWRRNPAGQLVFIVDAETDPEQISHLGDVYVSGEPAILKKLQTLNHADTDDDFNTDKWGTWLSGYAPFYRTDGQMEGLLGMDIKASDVRKHERMFLWNALAIFFVAVASVLFMGQWFGRRLAAPLVKLTLSSKRITEGDLSHRASIEGSKETTILAESFNKMTDTLQKAITSRDNEIGDRKKAEMALDAANKDLQKTVLQLSIANRQLRSFAQISSHDLKTPLRGIEMLVDWLADDYADKFKKSDRKYIDLLKKRVKLTYNYIDAIHRYTSIELLEENKTSANLNDIISNVIHNSNIPEGIITIGEMPKIKCDKTHIRQIFENLLSNAAKYVDKTQGRIVIGCTEEQACWVFSVADNGPGIDEKYHEKIFEVFQTLSSKDESEGVGIGLSIVKKIVELYNGIIWVESKIGKGTTFFFTFPKQTAYCAEHNKLCSSNSSV